jgi:hypothetical protein
MTSKASAVGVISPSNVHGTAVSLYFNADQLMPAGQGWDESWEDLGDGCSHDVAPAGES